MKFQIIGLINEVEMEPKLCPVCGAIYAIPKIMEGTKLRDGGNWFCPNGHSLSYVETEADKLEKRNRELLAQNKDLEDRKGELLKELGNVQQKTFDLGKRIEQLEKKIKPKKKAN